MRHRKYFFIFLSLSLSCLPLFGQSLSDLQQIEKLRKELEKMGELPAQTGQQQGTEVKSLETFRDSLSRIPTVEERHQLQDSSQIVAKPVPSVFQKGFPSEPFENLPIFGMHLFENAKVDYVPEIYGPVDPDYPLGPGDEIVITIWGEVERRLEKTIDRQGQVYIEKVGLVNLMGLTIQQALEKLRKVMGQSYSSLLKGKAYLDVSLGKIRSIRVYVIGDVNSPGVFTVPALTAPFTMLFYSAGINTNGSMRTISLVRNDKVYKRFDLYNFFRMGFKFSSVRLHNNDIIVVPPVQNRVMLAGAVRKNAVYELKDGEGLKELINFSGGFLPQAYIRNILIERYANHTEPQLINVNYEELISDNKNFILQNGDRVYVPTLDRELKNFVTISGPVYGPKKFEYYPGFTIKELFAKVDSISGVAYLDRVQITRKLPDGYKQLFSINLNDFLENDQQDFPLAPEDHITIRSKQALFPPDSVSIFGAVNEPGKYLLKKDMTLKDLIFSAGGFRKNALITEAEISRIDPSNTDPHRLADVLYVKIDSNYTQRSDFGEDALFFLQPYDNVFIRSNSDWELQRNVSITGEVQRPGVYTLKNKTTRITDLIARAGGLKPTAYLDGAKLFRRKDGVGQIGINFSKIFNNPSDPENIYLQSGDRIVIPERLATVKIVGGVNFPSSVLYEEGAGLDYYIEAAGGYTELADEDNVTIRLANGRPVQRKRFLFWEYLSEDITAGTTIYVPVLSEKDVIDWSGAVRDAAAILASVATVILIYDRIQNK